MTPNEAKRLLQKLGATFEQGKGSHLKVTLNGKTSILAMHGKKEIPTGTWRAIKKQLDIKE